MWLGFVWIAGGTLLIYAHIGLYRWFEGLFGTPWAAVGLVLVDLALVLLFRLRYRIASALRKPVPAVRSLPDYDKASSVFEVSGGPELVRVAELLRTARHDLHEHLLPLQEARRIAWESLGLEFVRATDSYLHLERDRLPSGYGDFVREQVKTLACTWRLFPDKLGPVTVLLTIDADAQPQLRLKPGRQTYPGTPQGWADMASYLWRD